MGDHFAHCGFRDRAHGGVRITQREFEILSVLDVPNHLILDIDDVLVGGQHKTIVITLRAAYAQRFRAVGCHIEHFGSYKRPWRKVQTLRADTRKLAQEKLDGFLFGTHSVGRCKQPCRNGDQRTDTHGATGQRGSALPAARTTTGPTRPATAAHQDAQLFLTFFNQLVDLGDRGFITAAAVATVAAAIVTTVIVATIVAAAVIAAA